VAWCARRRDVQDALSQFTSTTWVVWFITFSGDNYHSRDGISFRDVAVPFSLATMASVVHGRAIGLGSFA
jgi:hypothetical protein